MSNESNSVKRKREKRQFFNRYRASVIEDVYKRKFFDLFDNVCFKCGVKERDFVAFGEPPILCMDHHVPIALGGHFEEGNLVSLCRSCNGEKLDRSPEEFYSKDELDILQPLLEKQKSIFQFEFNRGKWNSDRKKYLLSIGVEEGLVNEVLFNEDHPDFVGMPLDSTEFTITVES
jgi:5-methylcytosine-specific restriction endonuclease McrA